MEFLKVLYIIFSILIIIFTVLLIIVYSKDKFFHGDNSKNGDKLKLYLCYFNIFFCIIVVLSTLFRLIPEAISVDPSKKVDSPNFICSFQAFILSLLDKVLISLMTNYSIITYLSFFKSDFYLKNLKKIYLILILIGFAFSLLLTIIYYIEGVSYKDILCYIHTRTNTKKVTDTIYTSILFIINLYCLISLIISLIKLSKKYSIAGNTIQFKKSSHFLYRYSLDLIINFIAFTYTLLVVNKVFPKGSYKDFIYIIICLGVELFFTINENLYKAFVRLVTCSKYYQINEENSNSERITDIENKFKDDFKNEDED